MPDDAQIRINTLLLEREGLFVRVHELEQAAASILGEPWPFVRPALPSDSRAKRKSSRASARARDPLRKLEPGEAAFRVTYIQHGQTRAETHDSPEPLRTLLAAQGRALTVLRIETLDTAGAVVAVLHDPASSL